jgi:hypothetical protein
MQRDVLRIVPARATTDGDGVRLSRSLGGRELPQLDPFLLLDEFRSDDPSGYIGGFPPHPHRGFETVTYMLAGHMRHQDSIGNTGHLHPGAVQWMSAASGIIHSEMPEQEDGLMWGFQLWVNLPAADKMGRPNYQDIPATEIPEASDINGVRVKVIAGKAQLGDQLIRGPVKTRATEPLYFDITLPPDGRFEQAIPAGHNAFLYAFGGEVSVRGKVLAHGALAVLGEGNEVIIEAGEQGGRTLLIAGKPIGEPVARYGPFVMNTTEEIHQAMEDYRRGELVRPG